MRFTAAAVLIASAGFAAAQTDSTTAATSVDTSAATSVATAPVATGTANVSSDCDAANIVKACLTSTQGQVDSCSQTDYTCLCAAYQAQLTCYNNCPNDNGRSTPDSYATSYCQIASTMSTSSTKKGSSTTASASDSSDTSTATTTGSDSSSSDSGSTAASTLGASASSTGLANAVVVPAAGSMLGLALGVFGML